MQRNPKKIGSKKVAEITGYCDNTIYRLSGMCCGGKDYHDELIDKYNSCGFPRPINGNDESRPLKWDLDAVICWVIDRGNGKVPNAPHSKNGVYRRFYGPQTKNDSCPVLPKPDPAPPRILPKLLPIDAAIDAAAQKIVDAMVEKAVQKKLAEMVAQ